MGPYCHYCGRRCFVIRRRLPDTARHLRGKTIWMATCPDGVEYDRESIGYDYRTANNPLSAPEATGGAL